MDNIRIHTYGFKVVMDTREYITRKGDPNDPWSGDATDTDWEFESANQVYKNPDVVLNTLSPLEDGQNLYLVSCIWNTGCSFSRSDGYGCEHIFVYDNIDDADAAVKVIKNSESSCVFPDGVGGTKTMEYVPWHGYFESVKSIEIYRFKYKKVN